MSTAPARSFESDLYRRLMAAPSATVPEADRHVLASVLALVRTNGEDPLTRATGLDRAALEQMLRLAFPGACRLDELAAHGDAAGEGALEEEDFRQLLLDGGDGSNPVSHWMATMVARRSLRPEHLWHALGLRSRLELSDMLFRHFPALAARNTRNMRWKKFFYREMCQAEGIYVCKSPVCGVCPDFDRCFGPEE